MRYLAAPPILLLAAALLLALPTQAQERSAEANLAIIDGNAPPHQEGELQPYRTVLDALSGKFPETKAEVADMTAYAWEMLGDAGQEQPTTLEMLRGINKVSGGEPPIRYREYMAAYLTLRIENSFSHEEAIATL